MALLDSCLQGNVSLLHAAFEQINPRAMPFHDVLIDRFVQEGFLDSRHTQAAKAVARECRASAKGELRRLVC